MSAIRLAILRGALRASRALVTGTRMPLRIQRRLVDVTSPPARGADAKPGTVGGVPVEWVTPAESRPGALLLYLHGGGYTLGSPRSQRAVVARLGRTLRMPAIVPAYRLAPEHPNPAGLDDVLAVYEALLESGADPKRIVVAGDSAGGGLALALAQAARDRGLDLPAALGLLSPWLDLATDVREERAPAPREPLLTLEALARWARGYVGARDPEDPACSPVLGNLGGLPPIEVLSAGDDPLAPDSDRLCESARAAGVAIEHARAKRMPHAFYLAADTLPEAAVAVDEFAARLARHVETPAPPRVGVVGAGMSGICMAVKLRAAGFDDVVIYEKGASPGGTWRENRYPGLTCDVPSRFYSYSFAPNPHWTHVFSPGEEIESYFCRTAEELGVASLIRFDSPVTAARWDGGRWHLTIGEDREDEVDVLVSATGVLHHPRMPEIPGMDSFGGALFHSARWDLSVPLDGRRVAVVGTGSTGVQIATELAGRASRLLLFQRTAQWILPVRNRPHSQTRAVLFERLPWLNRLAYRYHQRTFEWILGNAVVRRGWQRRLISALSRRNLRTVRDPELRRRLTPDYEPMCKRLIMSAGFYEAMERPDTELVTDAIDHIEERGIVTADGKLHEVDVIALATGFDAHAFMRPMQLVGEDGVTLDDVWTGEPRGYRTVALPRFPNFFMLMGPHSPVGNQSLVLVAEVQADYIVKWLQLMAAGRARAVAPTEAATERFNAELREQAPETVWASGCTSWYIGADGLPAVWPWTPARHREVLAAPELEDFAISA